MPSVDGARAKERAKEGEAGEKAVEGRADSLRMGKAEEAMKRNVWLKLSTLLWKILK
jgi:hypothetical protein